MFPGGEYLATVYHPPLLSLAVAIPILVLVFQTTWAAKWLASLPLFHRYLSLTIVSVCPKVSFGDRLVVIERLLVNPGRMSDPAGDKEHAMNLPCLNSQADWVRDGIR